MRLTKSKPVALVLAPERDALGQPLDAVELYKPVQPFMAPLDGAPMVYQLATRLPGNHRGVLQSSSMWIKSSVDSETAAQLRNAAIFGQPAPVHEPLTSPPKPIPVSRQWVVTRGFVAGAGTTLVKLVEGDVVDREDPFFADLIRLYGQNFRRADAPTGEAA